MLFGWLFGAALMTGGHMRSEWNRSKAKTSGKDIYTDVSGVTRYTDSKLPYSRAYENLKKYGGLEPKNLEPKKSWADDTTVKIYLKSIVEEMQKEEPNQYIINALQKGIINYIKVSEEREKDKADKPKCNICDDVDMMIKNQLIKEGYRF